MTYNSIKKFCCLLLLPLCAYNAGAQSVRPVTVSNAAEIVNINSGIEGLEDINHNIPPDSAFKNKDFTILPAGIPNKNVTTSAFWFRLKIRNETDLTTLVLKLSNPELDSVSYYEQIGPDSFRSYKTGESIPFSHREYLSSDFLFAVHLLPNSEKYIYLHVSSCTQALLLPMAIGSEHAVLASDKYKDIVWGMYIGLMIAMLLYNCFVYITTKDKSYLYYIMYMLAVVLTQMTLSGYTFQLLWPGHPLIEKYSLFFNTAFSGIAAIGFIRLFLKTKSLAPRADKILFAFIFIYTVGLLLGFAGKYVISRNMLDMTAGILCLYILAIAFTISRKGYRPAIFFLIAWSAFLSGIFIFIFKNFGLLPYNNFTVYTMPVGSAMEALLLSFALADRINMLKKEIAGAQANELLVVQENERIVREQNVILEEKVNERTIELKSSNDGLNKAIEDLKNAQGQLVESEKMASLGQLTAGIAHEINNPVNYITSHLQPLNRDIQMLVDTTDAMEHIMKEGIPVDEMHKKAEAYKNNIDYEYTRQEITQLLNGIAEGASRTAEIVKGLRIFSRLDEGDLKKADINDGLNATLAITNNLCNDLVKVEKKYAGLPLLECYPGQINQVFLNIISNAIYAIKKKFGNTEGGLLTVATSFDQSNVIVKIIDNGTGIDEQTRKKIFEPFFTTKDVGEGTGLGLSIAYNIIRKHNGQIHVNSKVGEGTEFIITIPFIADNRL